MHNLHGSFERVPFPRKIRLQTLAHLPGGGYIMATKLGISAAFHVWNRSACSFRPASVTRPVLTQGRG